MGAAQEAENDEDSDNKQKNTTISNPPPCIHTRHQHTTANMMDDLNEKCGQSTRRWCPDTYDAWHARPGQPEGSFQHISKATVSVGAISFLNNAVSF